MKTTPPLWLSPIIAYRVVACTFILIIFIFLIPYETAAPNKNENEVKAICHKFAYSKGKNVVLVSCVCWWYVKVKLVVWILAYLLFIAFSWKYHIWFFVYFLCYWIFGGSRSLLSWFFFRWISRVGGGCIYGVSTSSDLNAFTA